MQEHSFIDAYDFEQHYSHIKTPSFPNVHEAMTDKTGKQAYRYMYIHKYKKSTSLGNGYSIGWHAYTPA